MKPVVMIRVLGLLAWMVAQSAAQSAPQSPGTAAPERLQALLLELAGLDARAWSARIAALEEQAKASEVRATRLQTQASEAESTAKALRREIVRLEDLRRLIAVGAASRPGSTVASNAASNAASTAASRPASAPRQVPSPLAGAVTSPAAQLELVTFDRQISRVFEEHCTSCHDPDDKKGGLDLTTFAGVRQGGGSGRTIVPGDPEPSRLYKMIAREERPFMPKDADPLPPAVVKTLRTWIEQGAAEDAESARAFLARKEAAAKKAAASAGDPAATGPMPSDLPRVALQTVPRAAPIKCLVRSPRAPLLAMPGVRQVLLFDPKLHLLAALPMEFPHVEAVAFSSDGSLLAACAGEAGKRGQVAVFDVRTGTLRAVRGNERDVPLAVAVHAGSGLVALAGSGKVVHVLSIQDGSEVFAGKHEDFVLALDFSGDGRLLAAADRAGTVQVWETKGGRIGQTLNGHRGAVHALAFQPGGNLLATVGADGTLRMWDVAEGKETWRQAAHQGEALAVAFGPGDQVASAGSDGVVKVWSTAGKALAASPAAGEWLYTVAFGSEAGTVLTADWLGRPHRFDVANRRLQALPSPLQTAQ